MNDEELVEVIAKAIAHEWDTNGTGTFIPATVFAVVARDAIRSAGLAVYKPKECVVATDVVAARNGGGPYLNVPVGTYFLVPADSGGSG